MNYIESAHGRKEMENNREANADIEMGFVSCEPFRRFTNYARFIGEFKDCLHLAQSNHHFSSASHTIALLLQRSSRKMSN